MQVGINYSGVDECEINVRTKTYCVHYACVK